MLAAARGAVKPLCYVRRAMPARRPAAPRGAAARGATYPISALAREFALTTRAIRFYEDCGLLTPERVGGARVYGERERVRIKLILRGKRLGLSLAEIAEILDLYEVARNERAQLEKFLVVLADRRARLMQQKEDIDATLAEIAGVERECRRLLKEGGGVRGGGRTPPPDEAGARAAKRG
jgi:DNA-binding transcriptional MerR regulator